MTKLCVVVADALLFPFSIKRVGKQIEAVELFG